MSTGALSLHPTLWAGIVKQEVSIPETTAFTAGNDFFAVVGPVAMATSAPQANLQAALVPCIMLGFNLFAFLSLAC